jgi:arylsulfatase A
MKFFLIIFNILFFSLFAYTQQKPNVIFIYADDLGYGDVSYNGAKKIHTPNIDQLANQGIVFTNGHTTSATCTPSRYALITGRYPWRQEGTGILPGDAALIISPNKTTLPSIFQQAGYQTGIVGKWHLGLGEKVQKNWNVTIKPGPNEVGFNYSYIFPATADRVPTVFLENGNVVGLDINDPIQVSYKEKIGDDPTGKEHPELLKMHTDPIQGHDQTIVNNIGRIGYMTGGKTARWSDEELTFTFLEKAKQFIESNKNKPFFLYYASTEPHVPRMPATMFKGKSGLGFRGDAILQLDWMVGEIISKLKALGIEKNTMIIFSSDNGPVLNDGYIDGSITALNGHTPLGTLRGGKSSIFEGGNRVPFIVSWPGTISHKVSPALVSQIDLLASFANYFKFKIPQGDALDSENHMNAFLGKTNQGRTTYIEHAGTLAIVNGDWKYIVPSKGSAMTYATNIETGIALGPQLYNLKDDIGEKNNLANQYPEKVASMALQLQQIMDKK